MGAKDVFDDFVKSKLAKAPAAPAAEAAEEPAETLQPAEKLAEEPAEATVPKAEEPKPAEQQAVESPEDADRLKEVAPSIRKVLAGVDPKIKKDFVDKYYVGKRLNELGTTIEEIRQYKTAAPTMDVLNDMAAAAQAADEILRDYADPAGPQRFASRLYQTNPQAFQNLVSTVTDPDWLHTQFPQQFTAISKQGTMNALLNTKARADATGNADLATAVEMVSEAIGLSLTDSPKAQKDRDQQGDPVVLQRLKELEQREQRVLQERVSTFTNSAYEMAASTVLGKIGEVVKQTASDSAFNDATQKRMSNDIAQRLYNTVVNNAHIRRTATNMLHNGDGSASHRDAIAGYLSSQAQALLPAIARDVVSEYSEMIGPAINRREEKVAKAQEAARPIGGSGKAATGVAVAPLDTRGMTMKQAFDAYVERQSKLRG